MTKKAVFLDRDGTLIVDHGYICKPSQVELLPGVIQALKSIQKADYLLIIVSNQSGVGRGYFTKEDVDQVNDHLNNILTAHGIKISEMYYCPHSPIDGCRCRKPEPGLVFQAINDFQIDRCQSYLIGDKWSDVETAVGANLKPVWLTKDILDVQFHPTFVTATDSLLSWTQLMNMEVCDDIPN